jgi:ribosomal protein L37E
MSFLLQLIGVKAAEAGTRFHVSNTRKLKPTQRCAGCGALIRKSLDERMHLCTRCGFVTTRDRNAALVCLIDALWPTFYATVEKGKPFAPDGYAAFIRNRLLYAATAVGEAATAIIESPPLEGYIEPAHGTGAVIDQEASGFEVRETPTYSLQG